LVGHGKKSEAAFYRHLITFAEHYRLVLSDVLKKDNVPEFKSEYFAKIEGKKLMFPHRFPPDMRALEEHRNAFAAG